MKRITLTFLLGILAGAVFGQAFKQPGYLSSLNVVFPAGGGGFTDPTDIPGLAFWSESEHTQNTGEGADGVTIWTNLLAGGINMEDDGGREPGLTNNLINGFPAIMFLGSDALYWVGGPQNHTSTVFIVCHMWDITASGVIVASTNAAAISLNHDNNGDDTGNFGADAGAALTDTTDTPTNAWRTITVQFSGTDSVLRTNGVVAASGDTGTTDWENVAIGRHETGGASKIGVAAFVFYTNKISGTDISNVEGYLRTKYAHY